LLQQLATPAFKLGSDAFNVAGLFNGSGFNVCGIIVAQLGVGQLHHRMSGVFVDALAELLSAYVGWECPRGTMPLFRLMPKVADEFIFIPTSEALFPASFVQ
jgi:hypothetical protein